ncbi:hypothetical protein [Bacillus sp. dmp10]|uniref:hypothetical protein n=1 Tax=Bacillus sp. dmp10 TaxID=2293321 RepID=UPI001674D9E0|nr:hypothetical protein [Bacillus thuringiensis]
MKFSRVSQVSELTGLHPSSLRRMLVEHATIQKNKSFIVYHTSVRSMALRM